MRLSDDPCLHFSRCLLRLDNQMKEKRKEQRACRRACLHPDELGGFDCLLGWGFCRNCGMDPSWAYGYRDGWMVLELPNGRSSGLVL